MCIGSEQQYQKNSHVEEQQIKCPRCKKYAHCMDESFGNLINVARESIDNLRSPLPIDSHFLRAFDDGAIILL